jgi:hypothetical protein
MPAPDRKRRLTAFLVALAVLVATPLAVVAADAFTDVPDSNVFHDDIAWLADANVTRGCNPPDNTEFCPGDNVTREQMAAFMRRLAQYIDAEDGTPAQADNATTADSAGDADALAGAGPESYQTIVQADACSFADCVATVAFDIASHASVTIDAPADGVMQITGSVSAFGDTAGNNVMQIWTAINRTDNSGCGTWFFAPGQAAAGSFAIEDVNTSDAAALPSVAAINVPAGTHTVHLCAIGADDIDVENASLTVQWTQGGSGLDLSSATADFSEADLANFKTDFAGFAG